MEEKKKLPIIIPSDQQTEMNQNINLRIIKKKD